MDFVEVRGVGIAEQLPRAIRATNHLSHACILKTKTPRGLHRAPEQSGQKEPQSAAVADHHGRIPDLIQTLLELRQTMPYIAQRLSSVRADFVLHQIPGSTLGGKPGPNFRVMGAFESSECTLP